MPRRKENNVVRLLSLSARVNCAKWLVGDWLQSKLDTCKKEGVNGFETEKAGKDSRCGRREAERAGRGGCVLEGKGRRETGTRYVSRACKTERTRAEETGRRKKEWVVGLLSLSRRGGFVRGGRRRRRGVYIAFRRRSLI